MHALMGKSLKPLLEGKVEVVHPTHEAISGEMFNNTSVRMGDLKATVNGIPPQWKLYNLANDLGAQHSDIMQSMIAAYEKYAQDVGVVIPRGAKFEQTAKNNFPPVVANNTQTIDLGKMFAPGYPVNETSALTNGSSVGGIPN